MNKEQKKLAKKAYKMINDNNLLASPRCNHRPDKDHSKLREALENLEEREKKDEK